MLDIALGNVSKKISTDIWTIFDNIFSIVTIIGFIAVILTILFVKRFKLSLILNIILSVILTSIFIIIPVIFQSNWYTILYIWAPWSILGGLITLGCLWVLLLYKIVRWRRD